MKTNNTYSKLLASILLVSFLLPTISNAACVDLTRNMQSGSRDMRDAKKEVTLLQNFLSYTGHLKQRATGAFGGATEKAVKSFQKVNGLTETGKIGSTDRAKIKSLSCPTGVTIESHDTDINIPDIVITVATTSSPTGPIILIIDSATTTTPTTEIIFDVIDFGIED